MSDMYGSLRVLTIESIVKPRKDRPNGRIVKICTVQCECGSEPYKIMLKSLLSGSTSCRSCANSGIKNSMRSHGESGGIRRGRFIKPSPEYRCWNAIKIRCYNKNYKQYNDYGGRGIRVCQRWLDSFENFLSDMGRRPNSKYSIHRYDNQGDYSPNNCVWALDSVQKRNKRTTRWITLNGVTRSKVEWLEHFRLSESTFDYRKRRGLSDVDALLGIYS